MEDFSEPPEVAGTRNDLVGLQREGIDDKRDQETEQIDPVPTIKKSWQIL
jgi:hypothetical protein